MLRDRAHAYGRPRSARPVLYSEPLMDAAYEMLNMHNEGCLTGQQLLRSLVGDRGATAFPKHGYVHEAREELR